MALHLHKLITVILIVVSVNVFSQEDGVKPPVYKDYKNDSTYKDFGHLHYKVAYSQINLLKKGALLVRLKTNSRTISKLQLAGNVETAKNLKTETDLANTIIMNAYKKEFTFCLVYFFYSETSDSVRNNKLTGIFVNDNLQVDPTIICKAPFFLIAEQDNLYSSSLGIVTESSARTSKETGSYSRDAAIVVKNKYFIQLHKPFPYFQIKSATINTDELDENLPDILKSYRIICHDVDDYKRMKSYRGIVAAFNKRLGAFYESNMGYEVTSLIKEYVY